MMIEKPYLSFKQFLSKIKEFVEEVKKDRDKDILSEFEKWKLIYPGLKDIPK